MGLDLPSPRHRYFAPVMFLFVCRPSRIPGIDRTDKL